MSIIYSFFDNQTIGVDDLNKITARFVTEGVARDPSSVSDINSFISDIATAGVVPENDKSLKVSADNGILTVEKGVGIFQNGTVIELTEPETMNYLTDKKQYVYLISDIVANRAYIDILSDKAEFENQILLAVIEKGQVTDERKYSRGKLAYYGSSDVNNNVYIEQTQIQNNPKDEDGYIRYRVNINADMYNYIQILDKNSFNFTRYNVKDGTFISFGYGYNSYYALNTTYMIAASQSKRRWVCYIEKGEGYVEFKFKMESGYNPIPLDLRIEFLP